MASFDKASTRCMSEEVQYYHKENYTWNTEEEWRQEWQRRSKREREGEVSKVVGVKFSEPEGMH